MILYMNVYITEDRNLWPRYQLPTHSRLDVFKYALASLAVVPFSKVIIHAPLAEEFAGQEEGLLNYARQLFKDTELTFDFKRSTTLDEWKVASKEVEDHPDNLVWLFCNDDHIFLDYNLDMINEITELLSKEEEPLSVCYPSHWHEAITCCCSPSLPPPVKTGNFAVTRWNVHDSFQIMRKEVFLSYWKLPIGLLDLRRTDERPLFSAVWPDREGARARRRWRDNRRRGRRRASCTQPRCARLRARNQNNWPVSKPPRPVPANLRFFRT